MTSDVPPTLNIISGTAINYDAIGNPLNDGEWTYTWQNGRQLAAMSNGTTTASFVYNADGLRVQKTVNGLVTKYTLHGKNVVHMTQGSNELHFFYDAQNRPAVVVYNGTAYAYVKNLQGDIIAILDQSGNVVVQYAYDAWGKPLSTTGSMANTLGVINPFRYRGYVYDQETGMYYLRTRYYNSLLCRFANEDSQINASKSIFAYCSNSPVNTSDNSGKDAIWINASKWLPMVGHTSLLIEYESTWYYTYFGMNDVIMEIVPDERMASLEEFNQYVHWLQPEANPETAVYDSAVYIFGDFSAAYLQFNKDRDAFINGNSSYNLITNNCTVKSWNLLRLGIAPNGTSYGEYMDSFCQHIEEYSFTIVPNTNNATIRAMFPSHGFTRYQALKSIEDDVYNYYEIWP